MSATSVDQRPKGQGNKVSVQNGSIHQKDAVNDDDFEPYLSSQTNQVLRVQDNCYEELFYKMKMLKKQELRIKHYSTSSTIEIQP